MIVFYDFLEVLFLTTARSNRKSSGKSLATKRSKCKTSKLKQKDIVTSSTSSWQIQTKLGTNEIESGSGLNQSDTSININQLDPDVLRWENPCDNPVDEMRRISVYKANRRMRYMNSNNTKIASLTIKEDKQSQRRI